MSRLYKLTVLVSVMLMAITLHAQKIYKLSGVVTSATNGEKLIGANVYLKGTTMGAASDVNGRYLIRAPKGKYTVVCSYIGFEKKEVSINLTNNMRLNFKLKEHEFSLSVTVVADRAKERETPVAFTDIEKKDMEFKLGSRDIPLVLNTTPSVYATQQGGGAGDARINIRGFDQRNVAIMINGVPVNDMENGWVYWSNWDGLGDASNSIQVQRGLSAVNLATPSIGGTMNIITDPAALKAGFKFKQEIGSGYFNKKSLFVNSGLVDGKYAFSFGGVRKTGRGFIDKTWTDAWAYYFGASYNINSRNRLELYAIGAPQRHGQNLYRQNIAAYSHDYAKKLGYSQEALDHFPERGRFYNENWNTVSSSYNGKQYWDGQIHERYSPNFINERENYYSKPLVNLNWYSQFSDKFSLYTTIYYSGGVGGGSGTLGHLSWDYSGPSRVADWDATIAANRANIDTTTGKAVSKGILRNSVNTQWTIGAISKAYYKINDNLKSSFGIDWRTAKINHYREVRDLLGGDYFLNVDYRGNPYNQFEDTQAKRIKHLGDKINYYNTNTVDWFGVYAQSEYTKGKISAYGMAGYSVIKYSLTDHFKTAKKLSDGSPDLSSGELFLQSDWIAGYQIKGGADYRINRNADAYFNAGYVAKVPIFDAVIDDRTSTKASNPKTEKFISFEGGANVRALNGRLILKGNFYYTLWKDRSKSIGIRNADNSEDLLFLTGLKELHMGLEFQGTYRPNNWVRFDAAVSIGNWKYIDDVKGEYKTYSAATVQTKTYEYYIKDLKVGDAPQQQYALATTFFPAKGLSAQLVWKAYAYYYAQWDPYTRNNPADAGNQVWRAPNYSLWDVHLAYTLPIHPASLNLQVFAHVFNVFDKIYVQDATDHSKYNAYKGNGWGHSADDAEVFLGLPRSFNLGVQISY